MSAPRVGARAPNHLGDGVVALPAMAALARCSRLVIYGPRWAGELYRDLDAEIRPRGPMEPLDAAVLFAPSLRAALEAWPAKRRVGTPSDGRRWLLTDEVTPGVHPWDTYRALVSVLGARVDGVPRWQPRPDDPLPPVPMGHVGLNPVSAGGEVKEWPLFGALAERLPYPVVVYGGPGEEGRVLPRSGGRPTCIGSSLAAFGRALSRCALFVSNDSGAAHFARACGVPVLVLYGSTEPWRTGPLGAHSLVGPRPGCAPCYGRHCHRALACFDLSVDQVLARIEQALHG